MRFFGDGRGDVIDGSYLHTTNPEVYKPEQNFLSLYFYHTQKCFKIEILLQI
jgi:hypothetical protein